MYFTMGAQEVLTTMHKRAGLDPALRADLSTIKAGYVAWLRSAAEPVAIGPAGPSPDFVDDGATEALLLRGFITDADVGDTTPIDDDAIAALLRRRDATTHGAKLAKLRGAYELMHKLDAGLAGIFSLVVNRVFVAEIEGEVGGSSPKQVGAIWANPPPRASLWDLAEYLLHEFTHHVLFVDDSVYGHFRPVRPDAAIAVKSVIRRRPRPLLAAFHSLVVGLEILKLRRCVVCPEVTSAVHPESVALLESCQDTIRSIVGTQGWSDALRPRARRLFDACRRSCEWLARSAPEAVGGVFDAC